MTIFGATTEDFPLFDVPRRYDAVLVMSFGGPEGMDDVMPFLENVTRGRNVAGEDAPEFDKARVFYNHPGFIEPCVENLRAALAKVPADRQAAARVVFTAHSIPQAMAQASDYEKQLAEASRLVAGGAGVRQYD